MFNIQIADQQNILSPDHDQLRHTITFVLNKIDVGPSADISLALVDDEQMTSLNQRFFDSAESTDVISFDLRDDPTDSAALECEIVVNAQCAARRAADRGTDPLGELHLYMVHGLLHQLGFDDRSDAQARAMHRKEDQLLEELGFGKVFSGGMG